MKRKYLFLLTDIVLSLRLFAQESLILENESIRAEFDWASGSLINLENKKTGWRVVERAQLGQSFEMLVPLKDKRYNYVRGVHQAAPVIVQTAVDRIEFTWKSVVADESDENLDITFVGNVSLSEDGLTYTGEVINHTAYPVEYVAWPYLGEVTVPDRGMDFVCQSRNENKMLYPKFLGEHGYWGVEYPTQLSTLPDNSFLLVRNSEQGLFMYSEQIDPKRLSCRKSERQIGCRISGQS